MMANQRLVTCQICLHSRNLFVVQESSDVTEDTAMEPEDAPPMVPVPYDDDAENEDPVQRRHRMARWVQSRLKCTYCLNYTDKVAPSVGLPMCCEQHLQFYQAGDRAFYLNEAQRNLRETRRQFDYVNTTYLQGAHNQEALYRAFDELHPLYDQVLQNAVQSRLYVARYRAYEFEMSHRLAHPDQQILRDEILFAAGQIIAALEQNVQEQYALARLIHTELKQLPALY